MPPRSKHERLASSCRRYELALLVAKPDGSIELPSGEVVFFSLDRFVNEIVVGDACFMCGGSGVARPFTNEHIIPRWVLREFELFERRVTLPNESDVSYGQYTIPCCESCNGTLNTLYEIPVREILDGGVNEVSRYVREQGPWLLFSWLALLFVKTHLKDWTLRFNRDKRAGDLRRLGHLAAIEQLHHIHCVARTLVVGSRVEAEVLGTFFVLAADTGPGAIELFDYADLFASKSVLLRYKDVATVAVLDDSCAAFSLFAKELRRIEAPLSSLQLREVLAHVSFIAANLERRPIFGSRFEDDYHVLWATHAPTVALKDPPTIPLGAMLTACVSPALADHPMRAKIEEHLREGRMTYLFGPDGKQIRPGQVPLIR
jgi:hypothetical protein